MRLNLIKIKTLLTAHFSLKKIDEKFLKKHIDEKKIKGPTQLLVTYS